MKKAGYLFLLTALSFLSFLYGSAFNRTAVPTVHAASGSEESDAGPAARRWEYCAVSRSGYTGSSRGGFYWISYFRENGVEVVEIEEKVSEPQGSSIARAMAKLGEEGWEMLGSGELPVRTGRFEAIYFKRQKR
jgi:hypothetical protein